MSKGKRTYEGRLEGAQKRIAAPNLPYRPRDPQRYRPRIGLIGCGGITEQHLKAYKKAGYQVVALCDTDETKAHARREVFCPKAEIYGDYLELLARTDIEVVDIATHPKERVPIIAAALSAKKHVLSQKPFVTDLDEGEKLCAMAENLNLKLAVNQNGRWAPHFSYIRQALACGLIGDVNAAHFRLHWDHNWIADTPFNNIHHVVLYDFAIHWFDMLNCVMGERTPLRVFASNARTASQAAQPPLLGQVLVEFDSAQASLIFDADTRFGQRDETLINGTKGALVSSGPNLTTQSITLITKKGRAVPELKGSWFPDGFHGTMAELLCAIEENREPQNSARHNLKSLALCFAAVASADSHSPQVPGIVRKMS